MDSTDLEYKDIVPTLGRLLTLHESFDSIRQEIVYITKCPRCKSNANSLIVKPIAQMAECHCGMKGSVFVIVKRLVDNWYEDAQQTGKTK